ncbi:hypothetical protein Pla123a_16780 [Posidoniimonas polymericola]|uniref:Uncharacterized protein n=1 Tax=Posidoniimonas polymericola TaxID=2528002 RepID=A0A5C5YSY5_9BACT|nr:hypothetical protein [Posidoniimonas polymericola]TWT77880.1 hypothetical protein Pla123a_16780 [Posidoniimonas polymericola]
MPRPLRKLGLLLLAVLAAAPPGALLQAKEPPPAPTPLGAVDWQAMSELLRKRVSLSIEGERLDAFATMISQQAGVQVLIDETALDDLGIAPDEPVTINLRNVTLFAMLKESLKQLELTWLCRNECLVLTTEEEAETQLFVRVYPVGDFLTARPPRATRGYGGQPGLIDAIVATVASETWAENGGGEAEIRYLPAAQALVISQTQQVHLQIDTLLADLRRVGRNQGLPLAEPAEGKPLLTRPATRTYLQPASVAALPRVYED